MSLDSIFYVYNDGLSLEAGNSLATASIYVMRKQLLARTEAILLGSVFNVTSLKLQNFQAMTMLDNELDKSPMFDNLRTLSLNYCFFSEQDAYKFKALGRFLNKSLYLEELILKDFWYSENTKRIGWYGDGPELKTVRAVVGPIDFPVLENLKTLFLDECDLRDNFRLLRHLLRRSPNLEKLTVRCCELPKVSMGRKGKGKLKKTYSGSRNLVGFQCRKLKSTEIIYNKGVEIQELVSFLLDISGSATENSITLTKVKE